MINLSQQLKLGLRLTPQQVQYLKLLQLPTLSLEQRIKLELELNPMLELNEEQETPVEQEETIEEPAEKEENQIEDSYSIEDYINDDVSGYKSPEAYKSSDEDDSYEPPMPTAIPLLERLLGQLKMSPIDDDEILLAEEILGNIDEDGYLHRDLNLIVQDLNLSYGLNLSAEKAGQVLQKILLLDPPGIGARNLQECLIAQLHAGKYPNSLKELCIKVLTVYFEDFKLKRYDNLEQNLSISRETLKKIIDTIQHLNPKPGEGEFTAQENYITPDFIVEKDNGDFIITLNDRNIPPLRINNAYKQLMAPRGKKVSAETKDFVKKKFEAAKWFIASIHQRRETLMKVMRIIVEKQRQWFEEGETLKPMIYKDISEVVGVDISTISRVVNSKYAQTEYGVYPLRFFFTSGLESENGEDISNQVVKQRVKDIISAENPDSPLNDDKIAEILKQEGIRIARRTVAKYREQIGLPIARMRRKV
ncbi:MAG: RNA polymerase factor sigma-54 [Bacteroidetes bacterium]|nr:RNA polymerase factor sigma-54 [Bacteroidota bacterium]